MSSSHTKTLIPFLLCVIFSLLPFFEGGESPSGILLFHTGTLFLLCLAAFRNSRCWIPSFLPYFLPFLLSILISAFIAPYRYAAFLQLWDFCIAGGFAIMLCSILKENERYLENYSFLIFIAAAIGTLISVLLTVTPNIVRLCGTFVNPNDFACFALLLMIFGVFLYERESNRIRKTLSAFFVLLLAVFVVFATSRSVLLAGTVFFILYLRRKKPGRVVSLSIILVVVLGFGAVTYRFLHVPDPFQYYRLKIWKYSLKGILQDPYLGIGLNMLPYRAAQFNFPADGEIGRYARIAKTADNQYLQILAETGFLGFFTFLIGWFAVHFALRRTQDHFVHFRYGFWAISLVAFFGLPLNNTSILFLFLFLSIFPLSFDYASHPICVSLSFLARILTPVFLFILFVFAVYLPYAADREFRAALEAKAPQSFQEHLQKAVRYNPYQPYYRFTFVKGVVDSKPNLPPQKWLSMLQFLEDSTRLNPLESDFYAYKADIFRILHQTTGNTTFYSGAVSAYQAAIDLAPFNVFLRAEFAFFESRLGRLDRAEAELRRILDMEPVYLNARLLLVEIKLRKGDLPAARSEFVKEEEYGQRYKGYKTSGKYVEKLLHVNPQYKEEVRKRLAHASQS